MTAHSTRRPIQRRLRTYRNGGLRFDVRDQGPINAPIVVLLHGFPERASHSDAVSDRLHAGGLRTMAPDQRRYSPGARARTRASYRMSSLVDDVVTLVREVGVPVHLVGHGASSCSKRHLWCQGRRIVGSSPCRALSSYAVVHSVVQGDNVSASGDTARHVRDGLPRLFVDRDQELLVLVADPRSPWDATATTMWGAVAVGYKRGGRGAETAGRTRRAGSIVRSVSGLKPFSRAHISAWVRFATPTLR
jgi:pimeloyl-ACP methyl ester carboxylesterase